MKRYTGLLAATVVLTSAPAFACHRHLFFWHHCRETVTAAVVPVPLPVPVPVFVPIAVPAPVAVQVYVADSDFGPPPMVAVEPVYVAPAPAPMPPPPPVVMVPVAPAPVVVVAQPVQEPPSVARLAVKWAPGLSAPLSWEDRELGPASFTNNIGAEFRLNRYFAIRADLELRSGARSWEIPGIKLNIFPNSRVHPFGSLSLSVNQADAAPGKVSLGAMAAVGLDITLFKWVFLTAEARYNTVPGNCCALPRVTGLVGAGVQFL